MQTLTNNLVTPAVTKVLDAVADILRPHGDLVILIKPQFEAGKAQVGRWLLFRGGYIFYWQCGGWFCLPTKAAVCLGAVVRPSVQESVSKGGNIVFVYHFSSTLRSVSSAHLNNVLALQRVILATSQNRWSCCSATEYRPEHERTQA